MLENYYSQGMNRFDGYQIQKNDQNNINNITLL